MHTRLFFLLLLFTGSLFAQNGDHLFWYKGKLLKPNTLLTAEGDTVTFVPSKGIVKRAPKKAAEQWLDKMFAENNRTELRITQTVQRLSGKVPKNVLPQMSVAVRKAFTETKESFAGALSNTLEIPNEKLAQEEQSITKGPAMPEGFGEDIFDKAVSELEEFVKAHKDENITWVPTPPRRDFSYCYACDHEALARYQRDFDVFFTELNGVDRKLMQRAISISRQSALLQSSKADEAIQDRLGTVMQALVGRALKRAKLLLEKYGDDPERSTAVLQVVLSTDRQIQLMGFKDEIPADGMKRCISSVVNWLNKAFDERNYPVALNLILIFSTERQLQLLGINKEEFWTEKAFLFNRFKLSFDISAKVGANGGYQLSQLKTQNWFTAIPDSNCRLLWILVEPMINKIQGELVAAEWRGPKADFPYTGPKIWNSEVPKMRLDFCRPGISFTDTLDVYQFDADGFAESWRLPEPMGNKKILVVNNSLMASFTDVKKVRKQAAQIKNDPAYLEKMKAEAMKFQAMMNQNRLRSMSIEKTSIESLKFAAELQKNSRAISDKIHQNAVGKYHFEPVLHNKEAIVIEEKLNGKDLFPENTATEYAWFFLKLEHDPKTAAKGN